jgi:hypothetical protein
MRLAMKSRLAFAWLLLSSALPIAAPASAQEGPAPFAPPPGGAKRPVGCSLQGDGFEDYRPLKTSGYANLDVLVHSELGRLAPWFRVFPRLYFIDDSGGANALSTTRVFGDANDFPPDRDQFGTVLFGISLLVSEIRSTPQGQPNYTVTAILAHELGHTLQAGRNNPLPTVYKELQADFIAGWAIKFMQRNGSPDVDEGDVISSLYKKGDFKFNDPSHHGTRKERLDAFLAGHEVDDNDVNIAYQKGDEYVRSIRLKGPPTDGRYPAQEFFAANIGVHYVPVPLPDGTFGLRVSRPTNPDSPGGKAGLELGDVILLLDALPFRNEKDVLNHTGRTTIAVIDVRTGQRQEGVFEIP